jgi:hypothetical protein
MASRFLVKGTMNPKSWQRVRESQTYFVKQKQSLEIIASTRILTVYDVIRHLATRHIETPF